MELFSCQEQKIYRCYAYGRLSKRDRENGARRNDESNSIKNQRALIHDYISRCPDLELCMEGYDDDYTGTNFERPEFQKMLAAVEAGEVDCIVVKDLSRFGREHLDTGRYILKQFPAMGVRFIAITDGYDSSRQDASSHMLVSFKNLMNDNYCRDASIKIRSHLDTRRQNGKFIGAHAPYGYRKDPEDKNHLVIDDEAAGVVRDIFAWKIAGMSNKRIADRLNQMGVLSPMEYKQAKGSRFASGYKVHAKSVWSSVTVRRILTNVVYLGVLEQGKRTTPNYKVKTVVERPREEWFRVEGLHEPIVSQEDFDLVARLLLLDTRAAPGQETVYPLAGLLYCGDCLSTMARKSLETEGHLYHYYLCAGHRADNTRCSTHTIRAQELEQAVLDGINFHIRSVAILQNALETASRRPSQRLEVEKLDRRMKALYEELEKLQELKDALYRRYALGEIEEEDFREFKRIFEQDRLRAEQAVEVQKAELDAIRENGSPVSPWIAYFQQFGQVDELTRPIAVRLIDQVRVFEGGRLEITFRYQAKYEMALQFLELHGQTELPRKEAV